MDHRHQSEIITVHYPVPSIPVGSAPSSPFLVSAGIHDIELTQGSVTFVKLIKNKRHPMLKTSCFVKVNCCRYLRCKPTLHTPFFAETFSASKCHRARLHGVCEEEWQECSEIEAKCFELHGWYLGRSTLLVSQLAFFVHFIPRLWIPSGMQASNVNTVICRTPMLLSSVDHATVSRKHLLLFCGLLRPFIAPDS